MDVVCSGVVVLMILGIAPVPVAIAGTESAVNLEAEALLESGWWGVNTTARNVSAHCQWPGIICNDAGSVTEILLPNYGILDDLTNFSFSSFPNLVRLDLSGNALDGAIPHQIGALTKITYLNLSSNHLRGAENQIHGSVPPEIGNLKNLKYLNLAFNRLTGQIPSTLGNLTALTSLILSSNQISCSIPHELFNIPFLEFLDISSNQIIGSIPIQFGDDIIKSSGTI
ncbi:probable leucine-rich repeat receptor-like protein kinase At1g35710 [Coffea eugenioides]|uniref:probable leucine-rich repeat receptor-like protein kinase At1g35710 n=1 Tax=Coffea eugenioides TaxID=49369 RepID=UPI000F6143BE|nr:probable leucine-rich repeat receptor-like protein kinase At1g35710 [Coffea eugenioides]